MASASTEDAQTERFAKRLRRAATTKQSVPKDDVSAAIESIASHASARGLPAATLDLLLDALTLFPNHLDASSAGRIVKLLIPRQKVRESAVLRVVQCLGAGRGRASLGVQEKLCRWLVMCYNVLEDWGVLGKVYGVLFGLLDMFSLRGYVAHLLALTTRRVHVKPFRIQKLLELRRNLGNNPPLNALLQTYKSYYPDVIVGDVGPVKAGVFSHPDPEWMQKVFAIQEASALEMKQEEERSSFRVARLVQGHVAKRRKMDTVIVPEVHTYRAVESSVTLEDVRNVDDFISKLDRLELPSQLGAVLDDPLLQKLLMLRPSDSSFDRLNNWLTAVLEDELRLAHRGAPGASTRTGALLTKILGYTHFTRNLLPAVESFLQAYLQTWDGVSNLDAVLGLLCFLPLRDFSDLHKQYFQPVEKPLSTGTEIQRAKLLSFYTELLRNWTVTYHKRGTDNDDVAIEAETIALSTFMEHVGDVCLNLLQASNGASVIADAILSFYECVSTLPWENPLFRIVLPADPLVYHFVFIGDAAMVSRICGILSGYKKAFELCFKPGETEDYPKSYIDHFNGFLVDICNCLWRNRALSIDINKDPNAMGCTIARSVVTTLRKRAEDSSLQLSQLFSFAHSPAFALLSDRCFRLLEEEAGDKIAIRHSGPVTQRSLSLLGRNGGLNISQKEYRVEVLHYLRERGLTGIFEFMNRTMTSLIERGGKGARMSSAGRV